MLSKQWLQATLPKVPVLNVVLLSTRKPMSLSDFSSLINMMGLVSALLLTIAVGLMMSFTAADVEAYLHQNTARCALEQDCAETSAVSILTMVRRDKYGEPHKGGIATRFPAYLICAVTLSACTLLNCTIIAMYLTIHPASCAGESEDSNADWLDMWLRFGFAITALEMFCTIVCICVSCQYVLSLKFPRLNFADVVMDPYLQFQTANIIMYVHVLGTFIAMTISIGRYSDNKLRLNNGVVRHASPQAQMFRD